MPRPSTPIATLLVGGFLGSGKTTCILQQLQNAGGRVAVLVNEFGTLGIDGDLIRSKGGSDGLDVVELPGGCICCSQQLGFLESIRSIAEKFAPELLLIEPSGVAEMSELLQVLSDPALDGVIRLDAVITIVDAETFLEYSEPEAFGLFFLDQVQSAEIVLINKADLVPAEELAAIETRVALLNPSATVLRTEFCVLERSLPQCGTRPVPELHHRAPLNFDCLSIPLDRTLSETALASLLETIADGRFGRVLRGKGFLELAGKGWVNLQLVSGRVRMAALPAPQAPRLTLIGLELKARELNTFLEGL
jgi:G3E family GTPase